MASSDLSQAERLEMICGHLFFYIEDSKHGGNSERIDEIKDCFNKLATIYKQMCNANWCDYRGE